MMKYMTAMIIFFYSFDCKGRGLCLCKLLSCFFAWRNSTWFLGGHKSVLRAGTDACKLWYFKLISSLISQ